MLCLDEGTGKLTLKETKMTNLNLKRIKELQEKIAVLSKELKPLTAELKDKLENRKTPIKEGKLTAILKRSFSNRFDVTTFKKQCKKAYDKFLVESERKQLVIV